MKRKKMPLLLVRFTPKQIGEIKRGAKRSKISRAEFVRRCVDVAELVAPINTLSSGV